MEACMTNDELQLCNDGSEACVRTNSTNLFPAPKTCAPVCAGIHFYSGVLLKLGSYFDPGGFPPGDFVLLM